MSEVTKALETVATVVLENETGQPVATDNDVAIAQIEADRDITLAAIQADTSIAMEEGYNETRVEVAEIEKEKADDTWTAINHLTSMVENLQGQIQTLLTPIVVVEQPLSSLEEATAETVEEIAETLEETNLTPPSMSDETSSMEMEHIPSDGDGNPIQEVAALVVRPIIQLV